MIGGHLIKTYSRQQKAIALSSAEAELHALFAASSDALGMVAFTHDLGMELHGEVHTHASAALGIAQRRWLGKIRHIQTQSLWVQQAYADEKLNYLKVPGADNPSDVLTKHVPADLLDHHLKTMNVIFEGGRAESALELHSLSGGGGAHAGGGGDNPVMICSAASFSVRVEPDFPARPRERVGAPLLKK